MQNSWCNPLVHVHQGLKIVVGLLHSAEMSPAAQVNTVQCCLRRSSSLQPHPLRMVVGCSPSHPLPPYWRCLLPTLTTEDITLSPPPPPPPPHPPPHPPSLPPHLALLAPPTPTLASPTHMPRSLMSSTLTTVRMSLMTESPVGGACCQGHRVPPPSPQRTASQTLRGCSLSVQKDSAPLLRWCQLTVSLTCSWATSQLRVARKALRGPVGKPLSLYSLYEITGPSPSSLRSYTHHHSQVNKKESIVSAAESHASTLINSYPVSPRSLQPVM